MADSYGATAIPLVPQPHGVPVADAALGVLLGYLRAVLGASCASAWAAVVPNKPVVANAFAYNPALYPLNPNDLPARYAFRGDVDGRTVGERAEDIASDYRLSKEHITLIWIYPSPQVAHIRRRDSFVNGIAKAIDAALTAGRHPSWIAANETDTDALTVAAADDAVKSQFASPTADAIYTGAALDGAVGSGAISPPRPFTVHLDGEQAAFAIGSKITVTGVNALDLTVSRTIAVTFESLPVMLSTLEEFVSILSVHVEAQLTGSGTVQFGLGARSGLGSVFLEHAGLESAEVARWQPRAIPLRTGNGSQVQNYDALEALLIVEELLIDDPADLPAFDDAPEGTGADITYTTSTGSVLQTDALDL